MRFTTFLLSALPLLSLAKGPELEIDVLKAIPEAECGRKTVTGDTVSVHYAGSLLSTGKEFDSSYGRGRPLDFQLGAGRVIRGWDQGLLDMCIGEKRKLTIAPELGYGAQAMGPIPANSVLVFETELVGIKGYKKDEL